MEIQGKKYLYAAVGVCALVVGFGGGVFVGHQTAPITIPSGLTDDADLNASQFAPFWKAWEILDQKYIDAASTTAQDKVWGSIEGLASSYGDPYTVFFPPRQASQFQSDIQGNFEGVGMEIGIKDNQLVVIAPLKGSPAELAGVKAGDAILSINGTSTQGMSTDRAVELIRGPKGSVVDILFLSPGGKQPVERKITRDVINIPTLDTEALPNGIFVIRLYTFTATSPDLFRDALRQFVLSGDHKLIFDLRGNPGGYLEAAWDMASWFLPAGKVVVTEDFGGKQSPQVYRSKGYNVFGKNLDMLILVDNGSASAAEILSGALQEQGVAKLVGLKTFGKGSVQELIPITSDTSLKVTVAHWLTPNGHNLSHDGLDPDYVVAPATSTPNGASAQDTIMDKAVQLLNQRP